MKRVFSCIWGLLIFPFFLYSYQDSNTKRDSPATKLESFLILKGNLIVKEYYELGGANFGAVKFDALILYEPDKEQQKTKGLYVELKKEELSSIKHYAFLDMNEMDGLYKALNYIIDLAGKWQNEDRDSRTEVIYVTQGDFRIGFSQYGKKQNAFVSCGYESLEDNTVFIDLDQLKGINNLIEKGIAILRNIN